MKVLDLELHTDVEKHHKMLDVFNDIGQDALYMSHYELSEVSAYSANDWREFLFLPEVSEYITRETELLRDVEIKKLLKDISSKKGQVGTAQILTALNKIKETKTNKEGPAFVYCYIPLTTKEQEADNIIMLDDDPFIVE